MKIINFCYSQCSSLSSLFDLPDQSGAARVHSYNFLCSIFCCIELLYFLNIFLGKDNANFVNFYQKAKKTNRALDIKCYEKLYCVTFKRDILEALREFVVCLF